RKGLQMRRTSAGVNAGDRKSVRGGYRTLAYLLAAAGLSACAGGPNFKQPQTPAPVAYRVPAESFESGAGNAPSVSASGAPGQQLILGTNPAVDWWTTFGS